jgi:molybdopterin molybdotransferase
MAIPLLQAKTLALASVSVAPVKRVTLSEAFGHFLAQGVSSTRPAPADDLAAADGYAIASIDARGAKPDHPVRLKLSAPLGDLKLGHAAKVAQGSPVPFGADAVVQKDALAHDAGSVMLFADVHAGQGVRRRGEQWREKELVLPAGQRLDAAAIAVLGALGLADVPVRPLTRLALLASQPASLTLLAALACDLATEVFCSEVYPDQEDALAVTLHRCLAGADLLLACPDDMALFTHVLKRLDGTVGFESVALKPGRHASVAMLDHKPIAVLPGPPLSTLAAFDELARPMLLKRHAVLEHRKRVLVRLDAPIKKRPGLVLKVPARFDQTSDVLFATFRAPVGGSLVGALSADGWLVVPEERGDLERGDAVELELNGSSTYSALPTNPNEETTR